MKMLLLRKPLSFSIFIIVGSLLSGITLANLSVSFVPGTAFVASIIYRDALTHKFTHTGNYHVNQTWSVDAPVGSRFVVNVEGIDRISCLSFDVEDSADGKVYFWGAANSPQYSIEGNSIKFLKEYQIHRSGGIQKTCDNP